MDLGQNRIPEKFMTLSLAVGINTRISIGLNPDAKPDTTSDRLFP